MTTINEATCGEKTYMVSIGTGLVWANLYKVAAYHETEAADLVADYLEEYGDTGLYYEHAELEALAGCTKYKTAEALAEAHNLTCCGNHGIYIELLNIEEVPE